MKILAASLFLLSTVGVYASDAPQSAPAAPEQKVTIVVSATDAAGASTRQLTSDQLSLSDNGTAVQSVAVRPASEFPLHLAIVLLASKSSFAQQQAAAIDLVHKVIRPNVDRVFVITAGGEKGWSKANIEWKNDPDQAEKTIRSLDRNEGLPDRFGYELETEGTPGARMALQKYSTSSELNIFNVIWSMWASDPRPARRVVVMFRDPLQHSQGRHDVYRKMVEANLARTIAEAQQRKTVLHAIAVEDPKAAPSSLGQIYNPVHAGEGGAMRVYDEELGKERDRIYSTGRANLEQLVVDTGGRLWISKRSKYADAIDGIISELNSMYLVTFVPPTVLRPGDSHSVKLEAKQKTLRIDAANTYYYGPPVRREPVEQPKP